MAQGQRLNCSKADLNKQSRFRGAPVRPLLSKFMFTVKTGYHDKMTVVTTDGDVCATGGLQVFHNFQLFSDETVICG